MAAERRLLYTGPDDRSKTAEAWPPDTMHSSVSIGEIHVPGAGGLQNARSFLLTVPAQPGDGRPELLFALFSAEAPRKVVDKLCDRLADEIRPAYFQKGLPAETRFEAALKLANRVILGFLYEHRLSIPGIKLRGVVGALADGTLYASGRGEFRGMLFVPQQRSFVPYVLLEAGGTKASDPKFFSSLQAGPLPDGSRLLIASSELFTTLDESYVKNLFSQADVQKSGRDLKSVLKDVKTAMSVMTLSLPYDVPVTEHASPPAAAARRPKASGVTPPSGLDLGGVLVLALRSAGRAGGRLLAKGFVIAWSVLVGTVKTLIALPRAAAALADPTRRARLLEDCRTAPDRCLSRGLERFNALPAAGRVHFLLLTALATVFLHGLLFSLKREMVIQEVKAYEASLAEFRQLRSDFEASLIYANDQRSRELLARMEVLSGGLPEGTDVQKKAKTATLEEVARGRDKLRKVVSAGSPAPLAILDASVSGPMVLFKDALYVFSGETPTVRKVASDGSTSAIEMPELPGVARAASGRTGILLFAADGRAWFWDPDANRASAYDEAVDAGSPVLFYQSRLYTAGGDGTVWRRNVSTKDFGPPARALPEPSDLPAIAAMAADGALYLLAPDGTIRKHMKGSQVEGFTTPWIDPAPISAADLWTSPDSERLVFIDRGGRVFVVDKENGKLVSQLTSPTFESLSAAAVSDDGKMAYLLAGGRVLKIPLE